MATKPIPPGTKNVTVNLPEDLIDTITQQAKASDVNRSEYIRAAILAAIAQNLRVTVDRFTDLKWVVEPSSRYKSNEIAATIKSRAKPKAAKKS